jgi:predicted NAD/FAD-binding protein
MVYSMKIAVIGSGISGLASAYYLNPTHDVQVFEANRYIGGHTATVDVSLGGCGYAVDTGFIVYNDWTYPNFIALMEELGVTNRPTEMSFSYRDLPTGLEYAGSDVNTLFAQRRNLLSPRFYGMIKDILRFNRESIADLDAGRVACDVSLGTYLREKKYGQAFRDYYLIPMGSAIWSAESPTMLDFPLHFFLRFFKNHGLLSVTNRPQWRTIEGGSREYIGPLTANFRHKIRTNTPVLGVTRRDNEVLIKLPEDQQERFDHVIFACHSDQALNLLTDPSDAERRILSAIPYQNNEVILHTDTRLLPKSRRAWSSWNYLGTGESTRATATYNMNILQGIKAPETFCVTLNTTAAINPHKILGRFNYSHPVFTLSGMQAQSRWDNIDTARTSYCGAYWRNGFHEDGVFSALRVADRINGTNRAAAPTLMESAA